MHELAVIRFPGSNCDSDAQHALASVLGLPTRLVWHTDTDLSGVGGVVVPGGFSFGDYLRSGALAAQSPVMQAVRRFAERGGPVLGICNGFQVLTEAGLLPGALARNAGLAFVCRMATVEVTADRHPLLGGLPAGTRLRLPVAHHDGRYVAAEGELDGLERRGQVALRYLESEHAEGNPNGSMRGIAGVFNEGGNVLGMMPHPERVVEPLLGGEDGLALLRGFAAVAGGTR